MTEEQIIEDWFRYDSNTMTLPTVCYSEEVYNFIIATSKCINGMF